MPHALPLKWGPSTREPPPLPILSGGALFWRLSAEHNLSAPAMKRGADARTHVRRSFRVATTAAAAAAAVAAAAATSLLATSAEAFLCGAPDATGSRPQRRGTEQQQQQRHRPSRCALQHSNSNSRDGRDADGRDSSRSSRSRRRLSHVCDNTDAKLTITTNCGRGMGMRRPRALAPLGAAAGGEQPGDATASAGGSEGWGAGRAGVGTELAAGQPREGLGGAQAQPRQGGRRRPFGHITDETLDLIRASTSIADVIGQ